MFYSCKLGKRNEKIDWKVNSHSRICKNVRGSVISQFMIFNIKHLVLFQWNSINRCQPNWRDLAHIHIYYARYFRRMHIFLVLVQLFKLILSHKNVLIILTHMYSIHICNKLSHILYDESKNTSWNWFYCYMLKYRSYDCHSFKTLLMVTRSQIKCKIWDRRHSLQQYFNILTSQIEKLSWAHIIKSNLCLCNQIQGKNYSPELVNLVA